MNQNKKKHIFVSFCKQDGVSSPPPADSCCPPPSSAARTEPETPEESDASLPVSGPRPHLVYLPHLSAGRSAAGNRC